MLYIVYRRASLRTCAYYGARANFAGACRVLGRTDRVPEYLVPRFLEPVGSERILGAKHE